MRRTSVQKFVTALLALLVALLAAAPSPAMAADDGPGKWFTAAPGGATPGGQAALYEEQIRARAGGLAYWVPYPETRARPGFDLRTWEPIMAPGQTRDGVEFDGYDPVKKELVEAKGSRYAYLLDPKNEKWSTTRQKMMEEAGRQLRAANGTPIRWHFAEVDAQTRMRGDLGQLGIKSAYTEPAKPPILSAPGSPADPAGNSKQGGAAVKGRPGGVDFSTLRLNYLSTADSGGSPGIRYSFKNAVGPQGGDESSPREASDAFFIWLELQPSQFWVNLNPGQPDHILDPDLARTDVGKVMLDADIELKKSMSQQLDPKTQVGLTFWTRLFQGPDTDYCFSIRNWIVPKPATVRDGGDELYILDAPLEVMSETMYFPDPNSGTSMCPGQTKQRAAYNDKLVRELLLPGMERAVNVAPEYAKLRRIYLSRVAAEWYKQASAKKDTLYKPLIGQGIIGPWVSRVAWDPKDGFNEYLKLINATHAEVVIGGVTYQVHYGGIDMSKAPQTPLPAAEFTQKYPKLPATVTTSIERPTTDPVDAKATWLGGTTLVEPEQVPTAPPTSAPPTTQPGLPVTGTPWWISILTGLGLLVLGVVLLVVVRRRRVRLVS